MRISNINSNLKARSILANFANDGRSYAYRKDGKDVVVFAVEECDVCGEECVGPNDFIVVNARSCVIDALAARKIPDRSGKFWMDSEGGCDDDGNFVCPSCYQEGKANKDMLTVEGGV